MQMYIKTLKENCSKNCPKCRMWWITLYKGQSLMVCGWTIKEQNCAFYYCTRSEMTNKYNPLVILVVGIIAEYGSDCWHFRFCNLIPFRWELRIILFQAGYWHMQLPVLPICRLQQTLGDIQLSKRDTSVNHRCST